LDGILVGLFVGKFVGLVVGLDVGLVVGDELGLSDGKVGEVGASVKVLHNK